MDEQMDIKLGQIELPKLDVTKYVGMKAKIESTSVHQGTRKPYLKVMTEVVGKEGTEQNPIELRATRLFTLHSDAEGNYGWAPETALGKFLISMKVKDVKDLIGKKVLVQKTENNFLSFEAL